MSSLLPSGALSENEQSAAASDTTAAPAVSISVSEGGLYRFGPAAKLPPAPVRETNQPRSALEHVSDIALDWLEVGTGAVRAASARGHLHRYLGEIRQDSFAIGLPDSGLALAVADGLGSVSASHLGSALAARLFVGTACPSRSALASAAELGEISIADISRELTELAEDRGLASVQVATTLVGAVVMGQVADTTFEVYLLQLGDSSAWRLSDGTWTKLESSSTGIDESQLIVTEVEPLPMHHVAAVWREEFRPGDTLLLASDGVGNLLPAQTGFSATLAEIWKEHAPSPAELLQVLDATVKSFDDDRTVVGIRFNAGREG